VPIRDVRTIPVECRLPKPVIDANYIMATKPALLVEVETDDGLVGLGEAAHFGEPLATTKVVIEGELRAHLVGGPTGYRAAVGPHAPASVRARARRGPDCRHERHRHRALGSARQDGGNASVETPGRIPAARAGVRHGRFLCRGQGRPRAGPEMEGYCAHGFQAVKMKVGRNSDIEGSPLRAMAHRGSARCDWRRISRG